MEAVLCIVGWSLEVSIGATGYQLLSMIVQNHDDKRPKFNVLATTNELAVNRSTWRVSSWVAEDNLAEKRYSRKLLGGLCQGSMTWCTRWRWFPRQAVNVRLISKAYDDMTVVRLSVTNILFQEIGETIHRTKQREQACPCHHVDHLGKALRGAYLVGWMPGLFKADK